MAKLFLSYSRKDALRAQRFCEWLEREGHDVWRDDDDIGAGASFSSEIEKALDECGAVLVLWSAQSVQSPWVRDEAGFGRDSGKLIPVSLDGTPPPLGFRQFQAIDLSKWRGQGEPPGAERIRSAIERLTGAPGAAPGSNAAPTGGARANKRLLLTRLTGAVLAAGGALAIAFGLWRSPVSDNGVTIIVEASPTSPDRATAADYANVAAADMAAFLPIRFDGARVISPADVDRKGRAYRIEIAGDRHGSAADASLTLSDQDGQSIIWSKSWSVPDASTIDLREQVSQAASQAALCLTDARGGSKKLTQPALGLYISACAGLADPATSEATIVSAIERVVKLAPDFPRGWAMLSVGRAILAEEEQQRSGPDSMAIRKAREAIAIARKVDPGSGLPYLAEWHLDPKDPRLGVQLLDKAVEVDPNEPVLQARRSDALLEVGRMTDAVEAARRATELDPLWSFAREKYIDAMTYAGQFSRARVEIAEAHRKWPVNREIDTADFNFQYRYGDPRAAEQLMSRILDYSDAQLAPYRKLVEARLDPKPARIDEAIAGFRTEVDKDPRNANKLLLALGLFGRVEDAYRLLSDPAFQQFVDPGILFRPEFASIRADPRFMAIAARLRVAGYWRASGNWPDFCTSEQLKYDCKTEVSKYP